MLAIISLKHQHLTLLQHRRPIDSYEQHDRNRRGVQGEEALLKNQRLDRVLLRQPVGLCGQRGLPVEDLCDQPVEEVFLGWQPLREALLDQAVLGLDGHVQGLSDGLCRERHQPHHRGNSVDNEQAGIHLR